MGCCQIRVAADPDVPTSLVVHVARPDGLPACGIPAAPWAGEDMVAAAVPGPVTCQRVGCGR